MKTKPLAVLLLFTAEAALAQIHKDAQKCQNWLSSPLLFLHVGKTGGETVHEWLRENHVNVSTFHLYRKCIGYICRKRKAAWLITVRDPLRRAISAFNFRSPVNSANHQMLRNETTPRERNMYNCFSTINEFAIGLGAEDACGSLAREIMANPQGSFHLGKGVAYLLDNALDCIITQNFRLVHTETLQADIRDAASWFGLVNQTEVMFHVHEEYPAKNVPNMTWLSKEGKLRLVQALQAEYRTIDILEKALAAKSGPPGSSTEVASMPKSPPTKSIKQQITQVKKKTVRSVSNKEPPWWFENRSKTCSGNVFIDLGANCGNSIGWIFKYKAYTKSWDEFYLWEVNPRLLRAYLQPFVASDRRLILIPHAAWIKNQDITFYLDKRDRTTDSDDIFTARNKCDADSVIARNPLGMSSAVDGSAFGTVPVIVSALDVDLWLREHRFDQRDLCQLWLKVDIEGAEYSIIPHLLKTKAICFASRISIEWHDYKPWMGPKFQQPWMKAIQDSFSSELDAACPGKRILVEDWV